MQLHIKRTFFWLFISNILLATSTLQSATPPLLPLANTYQAGINIQDYWVSEKLDGVRAYWTGKQLISKQGNPFPAPQWFIASFPSQPLDGELWIARGQFEALLSTVRRHKADNSDWKKIRYMVFDYPQQGLTFDQRLIKIRQLLSSHPSPYLLAVEQFRINNHDQLMKKLDDIVNIGGEGLMLHKASALFREGRSNNLLKVKKNQDAEARVIAHLPGKGKYLGMLGAILVETEEGKQFKLGSGFSDVERQNPPPINSIITYKYFGKSAKGIPRFASFLRIRNHQ